LTLFKSPLVRWYNRILLLVIDQTVSYLFVWWCLTNANFNNISVISWQSVLSVEETGGPGGNHQPVASHWQTSSLNFVHLTLIKTRTHNISGDRHWLDR
jgi:hypothetical protein